MHKHLLLEIKNQTPYGFRRSPFITQQPYISTRPITDVAKVKGVFLKENTRCI